MKFYQNNLITIIIIAINFIVFASSYFFNFSNYVDVKMPSYPLSYIDSLELNFNISTLILGLSGNFFNGCYWQVFTSMFMHSGFLHIFMNMVAFYQFGTMLENFLTLNLDRSQTKGRLEFAILYIVGGLITSALSLIYVYYNPNVNIVGASGAICVLIGFYAVLNPKASKAILITIIILSFIPHVAWYCHLIGLALGYIYGKIRLHKFL